MAKGRRTDTRRQMLAALTHRQDQTHVATLPTPPTSRSVTEFQQDEQALQVALRNAETLVANGVSLDEVQHGVANAAWLLRGFANKHSAALAGKPEWPAILAEAESQIEAVIRLVPGTTAEEANPNG